MLATFLVLFREGLEASLIIAIMAIILKRLGKENLFKYLFVGIAAAVALCLTIGTAFQIANGEFSERTQEILEGIIGIVAVCVLTWMVFWMRKAGKKIKGEIENKLNESSHLTDGNFAKILISMAFFAVLREGIESVLFLFSIPGESSMFTKMLGGIIGLSAAAGFGYLIFSGSRKIEIVKFFKYTSIAIIVFAAGLLAGSLHSLAEVDVVTIGQATVWDISSTLGNKSFIGTILRSLIGYDESPALIELVAYISFIVIALTAYFKFEPSKTSVAKIESKV